MSRPFRFVILFLAVVLCTTPARIGADAAVLAKGTRACTFKLPKDQTIPDGVLPGTAVNVVAEVSEPLKTGIALLNASQINQMPRIARATGSAATPSTGHLLGADFSIPSNNPHEYCSRFHAAIRRSSFLGDVAIQPPLLFRNG